MKRATVLLGGMLLAILPTQPGGREPVPVGPEFQVSESTVASQFTPDVAMSRQGDFVIVWRGPDADYSGITGRAFRWDGTPRTGDFPVNTNTADSQFEPTIGMDAEGRFVVAWATANSATSDADLAGRLFDAGGTPVGPEILLDDTERRDRGPGVAMNEDGSFVLGWAEAPLWGSPPSEIDRIRARAFDADGQVATGIIEVEDLQNEGFQVDIGLQPAGAFVVVYDDVYYYDGSSWPIFSGEIHGRTFDGAGTAQGPVFRVDTQGDFQPSMATDDSGHFVVAWTDTDDYEYYGYTGYSRLLAPDGTPLSAAPQVTSQRASDQRTPAVAMNAHGDFVLVWDENALMARAFDRTASPLGPSTTVTSETHSFFPPALTMSDRGQIVVTWDRFLYPEASAIVARRLCLDVPYAVVASDGASGSLRVMDLETAAGRSQLALDPGEVLVDDISPITTPHGRLALLATNSAAGARLRVVEIGSSLVQHDLHLGTGESYATGIGPLVTPDGQMVVIATEDVIAFTVRLRVIDIVTGITVHDVIYGPGESLVPGVGLQTAPDSSMAYLATSVGVSRSARLRMVNLATGNVDGLYTTPFGLDLVKDVDIVVTPDGRRVLLPTSDWDRFRLVVLDTATGLVDAAFGPPPGERLYRGVGVAVTPDSRYALLPTAGSPSHLRIIDLELAEISHDLFLRHTDRLVENVGIVLTPDGDRAVLATDDPAYQSARLRVIEIAGGTIETEVTVGVGQQLQVGVPPVVTPDGEQALLASFNDLPRLSFLDLATGTLGTPLDLPSSEWLQPGVPLLVHPESDRAVWVTNDDPATGGHVRLVDLPAGTVAHQIDLGVDQLVEDGVGAVSTQCGFTLLVPSEGAPTGQLRVIDVATGSVTGDVPLVAGENIHVGVAPVVPPSVVLADCNANRIPDADDILDGTSADCNTNDFPDECEPDCNLNGFPDDCDITGGFSQDCDASGVPDECEADCNTNGFHDSCDIAGGTSDDCNGDGIPDECDDDCNTNTIPDVCDIFDGTSGDCNLDGVPDECQPELDLDGDGEPECSDNCPGLFNDQTDGDSDLRGDDCDCRFEDGTAWVPPGPTLDLRLEQVGNDTILTWTGPDPGAHGSTLGVAYDVIRTVNPFNFVSQGVCVESDSPDEQSADSTDPASYAPLFYLSRATNNCPIGNGPVGERSDGTPRNARSCP
jgi:hypothetical protein